MNSRAMDLCFVLRGKILFILFILMLFFSTTASALKPKVHIYTGLKVIEDLQRNGNTLISLQGFIYQANPEICDAILMYPGYFLAGTIGPDGFPDIAFGQMIIHPDTRCDYSNDPNCNNSQNVTTGTFTDDWLRLLWDMAHNEVGEERKKALAFVIGYFTHAAGDMWGHTFINQYSRGSWPEDITSDSGRDIIIKHLIAEGVIGNHSPDIRGIVNGLSNTDNSIGIKIPIDFLKKVFIDNQWAIDHESKSFIGLFCTLRGKLLGWRPPEEPEPSTSLIARAIAGDPTAVIELTNDAKDWLLYNYIECWTDNISEGLIEWLKTSEGIASDLFVQGNSNTIWDPHLSDFMNDYLINMLGINPVDMVKTCVGIPDWVMNILNPASYLSGILDDIVDQISEWNSLKAVMDDFQNYLFKAAFGLTLDEFKDYFTNSETYAPQPQFLGESNTREIHDLMDIQESSYLNEQTFACVYNTITLTKLTLMNADQLNALLFRYNVGALYFPDTSPNVMLGFIKSLDGNAQWCKNAPPSPIYEPNRSFSKGMPLWVDCLSRKNFFKKVFKDWISQNHNMVFTNHESCENLSHLPPVSTRVRLLSKSNRCDPNFVEITLTNHQSSPQPFAVLVTLEDADQSHTYPMTQGCEKPDSGVDSIDYSPIIIRPENIIYKMIFFYKVFRGTTLASPDLCRDEVFYIQLPNCDVVKANLRVYILREIYTAREPILANNTRIPPNIQEILLDEVSAYYETAYNINCGTCTFPPCVGSSTTVVYEQPIDMIDPKQGKPNNLTTTIDVPCQIVCYPVSKDADDDDVDNEFDNCALTPNTNQADCNNDRIGDACKACISKEFIGWVGGLDLIENYARAESLFEYLKKMGLTGTGPILPDPILPCDIPRCGPLKTIDGDFFPPLTNSIKEYSKKWIDGAITDKVFLRTMSLLKSGLSQQSTDFFVKSATLSETQLKRLIGSKRMGCLTFDLPSKSKGKFELAIPRVMLDALIGNWDIKFLIKIDGKKVKYSELKNKEFRTISIDINEGNKTLQIFGNTMGPRVIKTSSHLIYKNQPKIRKWIVQT